MSEKNNNSQAQKPKTSKLAIWSLVLGVIGFVGVFVLALFVGGTIAVLGPLIGLVGIILGIVALAEIQQSAGLLKGRILATCGMLACLVGQILGIYFAGAIFMCGHELLWREMCGENLRELSIVVQDYAVKHDGRYPIANEWCDLLIQHAHGTEKDFVCKGALAKGDKGRCHYAMNPNCRPNSPSDMVLLFETKGGWNQFGASEILTTENHGGKGCNILFNDGRVKFVPTERLGDLKWKVEEGK